MTLVEVLVAVVLVSVAGVLVYQGGFSSYKTLMRSRLRLEAQGVAFDKLWSVFNRSLD
jgi:type II secretory pathway pseudopilin PulG